MFNNEFSSARKLQVSSIYMITSSSSRSTDRSESPKNLHTAITEAYDIIKSKRIQSIRNISKSNDRIKSQQIQGITTQEEQEKEKVYSLISQLYDLIKSKQTQVITTQDDKSSEEQDQEEKGVYSLITADCHHQIKTNSRYNYKRTRTR